MSELDHSIRLLKIIKKAKNDPEYLEAVLTLIEKDPIFFFNTFIFTYDPRLKGQKKIPFTLYAYQIDLINALTDCYEKKEHLLIEKSRDMGYSWIFLGWILWKMLTEKGFSAGVGSQKFEKVDRLGDLDSLLEKIRFMLNNIPAFIRGEYESKSGIISVPRMESFVAGEAGDNIGRGGRKSIYFLDEFAHVERSSKVQEAISQNTDVLIFGSTPNGKGNEFARLRWRTNIRRVTLHWKMHPKKDQAWYDKWKEILTDEQIAQELDISYSKSAKGRVYKWFDVNRFGKDSIEYNKNYSLIASFDWGIGDPTACLIMQYYGNILHIIDAFEEPDCTIDQILTILSQRLGKFGATLSNIGNWYGDPDGAKRNQITGESIADYIWTKYHIRLRFKLPNLMRPRILSVRQFGEQGRILVDKNLHYVHECLENYKFPEKDHGENENPLHDWTSHTCSALEYYMVYEHGFSTFTPDRITTRRFR